MAGPRIQRFSGWGKLYDVGRGAKAVFVVVLIALGGQSHSVVRFGAEAPKQQQDRGPGPQNNRHRSD